MQVNNEITICMGSSCFSRGNDKHLKLIENYLKEKTLEAKITFKGSLCSDKCKNGPIVKINDKVFKAIDHMSLTKVLDKELNK